MMALLFLIIFNALLEYFYLKYLRFYPNFSLPLYDFLQSSTLKSFNKKGADRDLLAITYESSLPGLKKKLKEFQNKYLCLLFCKDLPNPRSKKEVLNRSFHKEYILMTRYLIFNCKVDPSRLQGLHNKVFLFVYYKALILKSQIHSYPLIWPYHRVEICQRSKFNKKIL